jgi:hypothetical protein
MVVLDYYRADVLGQVVELFRDETAYGFMTIAVMDDVHYQLGDKPATLQTVLDFWQKERRTISAQEMELILTANNLKSLAQ